MTLASPLSVWFLLYIRVLKWTTYTIDWGDSYFIDSDEALLNLFDDLQAAIDRRIDRWQLDVRNAVASTGKPNQPVKYMMNYFSIGIDGQVSSSHLKSFMSLGTELSIA